jgi:hypothetical protein
VGAPLPAGCPGGPPLAQDAGCGEPAIAADRDALEPGANVTFTLTLRNCGEAPLRVEASGPCHLGREVSLTIDDPTGQYLLVPNRTAASRLASAYHCPVETIPPGPPRLTLPPGASFTDTLVWNGTAARDTQTWRNDTPYAGVYAGVAYERLTPGARELTWIFGTRIAHARVTLEGPARNATHLLLVHEWDWRNGTAMPETPVPSSACAPSFDASGLRVPPGFHLDDYGVLRAYAGGPAAFETWGPGGGALASPYDEGMTLLVAIPTSAGGLYVNGTALQPGDEITLRVATPEGEHVLVARDEGVVAARIAPC